MFVFVQLLANAEALLVRQRFEGWELFTNFDARNKYEILDQNGRTVAYAAEQNKGFLGFLGRNILGQFRRIEIFVFDADHKLVYRGQLDDSRPNSGKPVTGVDLRAALDQVLAGKPTSEEQCPSIGCNIKWRAGAEPEYFSATGVQ